MRRNCATPIGMLRVGDKVEIGLLRDGKPRQGHGADRRKARRRRPANAAAIHKASKARSSPTRPAAA
jgi:hypothetical protein